MFWTTLPAAGLVPGDIVKLSLGAVVAADVRLIEGEILLDQSIYPCGGARRAGSSASGRPSNAALGRG
jgi:hypothetical protein